MRLIDADEIISNGFKNKTIAVRQMQNIQEVYEGRTQLQLVFDDTQRFIDTQPTVDAIVIPKEITNGDMCRLVFGELSPYAFDPECKFKEFWQKPYKREVEECLIEKPTRKNIFA